MHKQKFGHYSKYYTITTDFQLSIDYADGGNFFLSQYSKSSILMSCGRRWRCTVDIQCTASSGSIDACCIPTIVRTI